VDDEKRHEMANATGMTSIRVRDLLKQVVPEHWIGATLEVVVSDEDEDHLFSIVGPICNQDSLEVIHDFPDGLLEAIEDHYLAFLSYGINWKRCVIRLETLRSGGKLIGEELFYD
jgi:hypothetical protein